MKTINDQTQKIWYQFPEVWLVIALPLLVVIASIVTIIIAFQHAPQIVVEAPPLSTSQISPVSQFSKTSKQSNIRVD